MLGFNKYIRINFEASHNAFTHWSSMDVISTNFEEIVSKLTMTIAHLPSFTLGPTGLSYLTLDADVEGKPVCDEPAICPHTPPCSGITPPATTPTSLCLDRTWALSLRTLATNRRGGTLAGNQNTGLVQLLSLLTVSLPFLLTVCALLHSRYRSKVLTPFRGLHQLATVKSLHLCPLLKGNGKPKETREQRKVKIGQQQQLAESALPLLLAKASAGKPCTQDVIPLTLGQEFSSAKKGASYSLSVLKAP